MNAYTVALFGEAEKGEFQTPYRCHSVGQLVDFFGNPPPESKGIYYAVQALLFKRDLIFLRVQEEGFNGEEYLEGVDLLRKQQLLPKIQAICLPGVGDQGIFDVVAPVCQTYRSIMIMSEPDLYDYLTSQSSL